MDDDMDHDVESAPTQTHLFTLRIWSVEGDAASQWRARLQNVQSGEVTFFKNWQEMIACLEESLNEQGHFPPPG